MTPKGDDTEVFERVAALGRPEFSMPQQVRRPAPQPQHWPLEARPVIEEADVDAGGPVRGRRRPVVVLVAMIVGSLVSVGLGVFGRLHEPTFVGISIAGFSSGTAAKSWGATAVMTLVLVQLLSAVLMYRVPARWPAFVHRWAGRAAVLGSVPIAMHCLYALGFDLGSPRVLAHSLAGCLVYGAFTTKMLMLQTSGTPRWALPLFGGLLFTALTAVWLTSAVWFFTTSGFAF